ncbi:hypothetical protein OG500_23090 [Kitasatospora sp. NBC_01250]|uniref:hypothetical protein n=1 Tax=Kitasatospora sp. NBC_01250 TaxID=2903571 RepID=UPI002E33D7BE|nr:hypothetical protein [Kitasatospora sp. NBC_01250]
MRKRDKAVPPSWERVHLPHLPDGVTLLSIPGVGLGWYLRRWRYWAARVIILALAAGAMAVSLLMYKLILVDDPHTTRFGAEWWGVVAFGVLATIEGFRMAFFSRELPFPGLRKPPSRAIRNLLALPLLVYILSIVFLAPGVFLSATIDALRLVPHHERTARDDLIAQLRALPGYTER